MVPSGQAYKEPTNSQNVKGRVGIVAAIAFISLLSLRSSSRIVTMVKEVTRRKIVKNAELQQSASPMAASFLQQELANQTRKAKGQMKKVPIYNSSIAFTGNKMEANRSFPATKFTKHVKEVISHIYPATPKHNKPFFRPYSPHSCGNSYRITIDKPYSTPSKIECNPRNAQFCKLLLRIFKRPGRILPYNVSLGTHPHDMVKNNTRDWAHCIASSAANGLFSMSNFQDAMIQSGSREDAIGFAHPNMKPWEQREARPIFRGHPRLRTDYFTNQMPEKVCPTMHPEDYGDRLKVAIFSLENPDILDATLTYQTPEVRSLEHPCLIYNATNGLDRILQIGKYKGITNTTKNVTWSVQYERPIRIPSTEYYTNYQVSLVLGGIGAAFRTARHLSAGQAIVLQDFTYEEWYYRYMTPYVHYIPLQQDLSDLKEIMLWIRENPDKVKAIAEKGKEFYYEYLSFPNNEEHWYELVWRLSEKLRDHNVSIYEFSNGTRSNPIQFVRSQNRDYVEVTMIK